MKIWNKIKNFFYWGWKLQDNYDWDAAFLYQIIYLKIQKMQEYHLKHGITIEGKSQKFQRRMKIAAECMKRLSEENYSINIYKKMDKEWNESYGVFVVTNAKKFMEEEENMRKRDMEMFCEIFKKYSRTWWS